MEKKTEFHKVGSNNCRVLTKGDGNGTVLPISSNLLVSGLADVRSPCQTASYSVLKSSETLFIRSSFVSLQLLG